MRMLNESEFREMKVTPPETCPECGARLRKNYCRECGEFFWQGHTAYCPSLKGQGREHSDDHRGHRTY